MLKVEVAYSPSQLEHGLMFRTSLADDEGMLFLFPSPRHLSFWGKNTFIPLDIAFINRDGKIERIAHIKPFDLTQVCSNGLCTMALEVNRGYFAANSIEVGDEIILDTGDDLRAKASVDFRRQMKQSQVVMNDPLKTTTPPVHPPHQPPPPQVPPQDERNLPTLTGEDLAKILEDSFDDQEEPDQDLPEEQPLPGEEPEEEPQPEIEIPHFNNIFDAAKWAEENRQVMRIAYTTAHGRQLSRDIEPHGQFHADSTMHQILVCYDETVNDIRAFIMTNIGSWSFLGRTFQKKFVVRV